MIQMIINKKLGNELRKKRKAEKQSEMNYAVRIGISWITYRKAEKGEMSAKTKQLIEFFLEREKQ